MSNTLYDSARGAFAGGQLNWTALSLKACLVDSNYAPLFGTHEVLSDVSGAAIVATASIASPTIESNGACDAADVTFTSVSHGSDVKAIVIYADTGVPGTSQLIAYMDTATGLPITPNGGDIIVTWDAGENRIFRL